MMRGLIDTNILLRSAEPAHPMRDVTVFAVQRLFRRGDFLCILPQNLIEFWSVATRPADKNGLGMAPAQAAQELIRVKSLFRLLPETPAIFPEWERLVMRHRVAGKQVHDTRLVAAMNVYGLTHLVTFNGGDFRRFQGITIVSPEDV